jgi:hypothetical protein
VLMCEPYREVNVLLLDLVKIASRR